MGLTRQAVQASVNRGLAEALVEARDNLNHQRSPRLLRHSGAVRAGGALRRLFGGAPAPA
jgi:hypothetical protein